MCFGGGSKKTPAPAQPTKFEYGPADSSNAQRQQAAMLQDTPGSFGSELGSASAAAPAGNLAGSAATQ